LLEIVLAGASGLATGEGTLMVPFSGVDPAVAGEMTAGRK
jgi:hypothetical protein